MVRTSRLIGGLLLIPLVDALLLVVVAGYLGWELTVALVVLTALLGMLFVRAEGRHTLRKLQRAVAEGRQPTDEIVDGGLLLVAGAFLLTPGLVTDAIGFLLVVPPTRALVRRLLLRFVLRPYLDERTGGFVSGNVYTFGFPGDGPGGGPGGGRRPGGGGSGDGSGGTGAAGPFGGAADPFDVDAASGSDDATTVDFEDVRDVDEEGDDDRRRGE